MPMDQTDKKLVNGVIWIVVLGAAAYFLPSYGYQAQAESEDVARNTLLDTKKQYDKYYTPMHPAVFGTVSTDEVPAPSGRLVSEIKDEYSANNDNTRGQIDGLQKISRMNFPAWTEIPDDPQVQKAPGFYFARTYERKRFELENEWRMAKVECADPKIGFDLEGGEVTFDKNKTEEYLRELHIAENIIRLCIKAKLREHDYQVSKGVQPQAYMKIVSVRPQPSVPTGPSALIPNPKYSKDEKNPLSERFRKYNVQFWNVFIQEYPVEIMLQCDYNTFQRFLHSVRAPGQFLVIRSLEILSPFANESIADKSEIAAMLPKIGVEGGKGQMPKDEQILVKISASGMDFFDPIEKPGGLYKNAAKDEKKQPTQRVRYKLPPPK
ncbi:MAG TPA: hypothetical protein VEJ63_16745 [Planctomycetota bacterium]|nr:hypothetical protein [Planctomycetota bacterium]